MSRLFRRLFQPRSSSGSDSDVSPDQPIPASLPQASAPASVTLSKNSTPPTSRSRSSLALSSLSPTSQLPASALGIPPPMPTFLRPLPRSAERGMFYKAHRFDISNSQFIDNSSTPAGTGLEKLLRSSMPDAFHDSAARYPPPSCHLGTRRDYVTRITDWAHGNSDHHKLIIWMRGPFGVGKTAVAQSCAEALKSQHKLAATLFFSRSNSNRDDPQRLFTSIAYQIATICEPFGDIIDARVRKDPALTTKSLSTQFEELLVSPLRQVDAASNGIEGRVVIIDGLDECRGSSEQCEIIKIIAASARNRTTPFRWFITSRPEDPIIRSMNSPTVFPASSHFVLPVSRDVDHEILYLTDEFKNIRENYHLPDSWPSEDALALLVERTAGLWIYATTIIRFITDENSYGPEDQLRIVLESARAGPDNPLAEMDFLYTLIMKRIQPKIRKTVQRILLIHSVLRRWNLVAIAILLDLSEEQFCRCCTSIRSVMELQGSNLELMTMRFYHASFLDFMTDPKRSKDLCIYGNFLVEFRRELLDWLHEVTSRSIGSPKIRVPSEPPRFTGWNHNDNYRYHFNCFLNLCAIPRHPFDFPTAVSLEKLPFQVMLRSVPSLIGSFIIEPRSFLKNLPAEIRSKIIRRDKCPLPRCTNTENVWILGCDENETIVRRQSNCRFILMNNYDAVPGHCVCGSQVRDNPDNR